MNFLKHMSFIRAGGGRRERTRGKYKMIFVRNSSWDC